MSSTFAACSENHKPDATDEVDATGNFPLFSSNVYGQHSDTKLVSAAL